MANDLISEINERQIKKGIPEFKSGDTVKVSIRITENKKTRIQVFEGVVLKVVGGGIDSTFTVRKMSSGVGVEKTFPVNSPNIVKIEVVKKGKVRRNKITYLRNRTGKSARIKEVL